MLIKNDLLSGQKVSISSEVVKFDLNGVANIESDTIAKAVLKLKGFSRVESPTSPVDIELDNVSIDKNLQSKVPDVEPEIVEPEIVEPEIVEPEIVEPEIVDTSVRVEDEKVEESKISNADSTEVVQSVEGEAKKVVRNPKVKRTPTKKK